jgi:RNA polymerase sigma-70 factor (ECF subfamily)
MFRAMSTPLAVTAVSPDPGLDPATALAAAAEAYRPRLLAAAERILRDAAEAEDAVQDALVSALRSLDRVRGDAQLSSWLYRITVNCALMRLRSRRRHPATPFEELPGALAELADADGLAADERLIFRQEYAALGSALAELPEAQRDALALRGVEELAIPEVAQRIGRSANATKMLVHRARERLREELAAA